MIAYFFKTRTGCQLVICERPCNGAEFQAGQRVAVANKKAAKAYCKANGITPHNFW
jgi:hypothetical protein